LIFSIFIATTCISAISILMHMWLRHVST
jgi:hypothetical protein